jgi:PAS domain S-box-containing protein
MVIPHSWPKPPYRWIKPGIAVAAIVIYILTFILLFPSRGLAIGALATLPVIVVAWFWGTRAGLVAVLLSLPINTILYNLAGVQPGGWNVILASGGGIGTIALLLVGAAVGRLRDLGQQLSRELGGRQKAEVATYNSESRFRALIENSTDAIALLSREGRLQYVSPATTRILGYSADDLYGIDPASLIHPNDLSINTPVITGLMQTPGGTVTAQFRYRHKDGSWCWLEAFISNLLDDPAVKALVFNYRDITEHKEREHELLALVTVNAALRAVSTRADMAAIILNQLTQLFDAAGTAFEMLIPTNGDLTIELATGIWKPAIGDVIPSDTGISSEVLVTRQPYLNNDAVHDPRLFRPELFGNCRAIASAPLITEGQILGLLWLCTEHTLSDDDLHLLTSIADLAANALQRETLHEQVMQQVQRLAALRDIDQAISGSVDLQFTLNIIMAHAKQQLNVDSVSILLLNKSLLALEYVAGLGFRTNTFENSHPIRLGEGYAGKAALARRPVHIQDFQKQQDNPRLAKAILGEGFVSYYAMPLIAKGQVTGVIEVFKRSPLQPDPNWLSYFEALAGQTAIAVESAQLFDGLQRSNTELKLAYDDTIEGWSRAMDLRDKETEGHTLRVTELTLKLATVMDMSPEELIHIRRGSLLHDMGKMGVPDAILLKPDTLTDEEWVHMRKHPQYAYEMLAPIEYLRRALDIPYCHHEKWDGTGYPRGLKGPEIPLAARIFAVADVWDALRSDRPYRKGWASIDVLKHIKTLSGTHFDPHVVEEFLQITHA